MKKQVFKKGDVPIERVMQYAATASKLRNGLDFSPASLKVLDSEIDGLTEIEPGHDELMALGSYVGEVFRRSLGMKWFIADPFHQSFVMYEQDGNAVAFFPYEFIYGKYARKKGLSLDKKHTEVETQVAALKKTAKAS